MSVFIKIYKERLKRTGPMNDLCSAVKESIIVFKQQKLADMAISINCLDQFLGEGAYSWVYALKECSYVAKIGKNKGQSIDKEYAFLSSLSKAGGQNFPKVLGTGTLELRDQDTSSCSYRKYLLMQRLGVSVEQLISIRGHLSLSTITAIGRQILEQLSILISHGISHNDIKPANILFGLGQKRKKVFLIDYGLSCNSDRGSNSVFRGNMAFSASMKLRGKNGHFFGSDLQSLIYVLLWLLADGKLPWQLGEFIQNSFQRRAEQILSLRNGFILEILSLEVEASDKRGTFQRELVKMLQMLSFEGGRQKEMLSKLQVLLS